MALELYRRKRDFEATREPRGRPARRSRGAGAGHAYVIQKHAARRLHYDLRLEMDGVLKSWAVTRGPSLVAGEKRLAVHVEDHPLDYGGFEGAIPKGQYGGGSVIVWDRGTWRPIGDPHEAYAKGHLEFELLGEKLTGRWHLVRMHGKPREKRENWLLIKADDAAARPEGAADILAERPESVATGRDIAEIGDDPPPRKAEAVSGKRTKAASVKSIPTKPATKPATKAKVAPKAKAAARHCAAPPVVGAVAGPLPAFVAPALASLVRKAPAGRGYVHEIKFDGYRIAARIDRGRVRLFTRTGLDWTDRFGAALARAFAALPATAAMIDGELVVETEGGATSFSALQADLAEGRTDRFRYYAFDLLHLDGWDLRAAPLLARKAALARLMAGVPEPLRLSEHFEEEGAVMLRHACRLSLEGVVSKRRDAPYRSGRTKDWQKSKCSARQEFVIGGYVVSSTSAKAIGSLVLGVYEKGRLRSVGRVGTGFTARVAADLYRRLEPLRRTRSPFAGGLPAEAARGVRHVAPELVAEVEFRSWTADRNLRHASFRGLREDKPATEIVEEGVPDMATRPAKPAVTLTHPDRLYWPDDGVTKEGLADYYAEVWPHMAEHIVARPLALLRCPDGIAETCFFQKHAWRGINRNIRLVPDPHEPGGEPLLAIDDLAGLVALVQSGVLEIHPWGASLAALEQPDTMIFDLDPGDGVAWPSVVALAREIRARLEAAGLAAFVKTSGGKGLHVNVPLVPAAGWDDVKAFAKALAASLAADAPERVVAVAAKAKRPGRIFVDYLRNARGATAVAPYSTRARPGAAVSMPLSWEELGEVPGPAHFTVGNAVARLASLSADPWASFRKAAAKLPAAASGRGGRAKAKR